MIIDLTTKLTLLLLLFPITLLHIYWLCGGEKWLNEALPISLEQTKKRVSASLYKITKLFSLLPVIITLILLQLNIMNFLPLSYKMSVSINVLFAYIFLLRGLLGFTVINWVVKKELFKRYNTTLYFSYIVAFSFLIILNLNKQHHAGCFTI